MLHGRHHRARWEWAVPISDKYCAERSGAQSLDGNKLTPGLEARVIQQFKSHFVSDTQRKDSQLRVSDGPRFVKKRQASFAGGRSNGVPRGARSAVSLVSSWSARQNGGLYQLSRYV